MVGFGTRRDGRVYRKSRGNLTLYYQVYVVFKHPDGGEWEQEFGSAERSISAARANEAKAKEFYPTARTRIRHLYLETGY